VKEDDAAGRELVPPSGIILGQPNIPGCRGTSDGCNNGGDADRGPGKLLNPVHGWTSREGVTELSFYTCFTVERLEK
jgi:hypothetical protein